MQFLAFLLLGSVGIAIINGYMLPILITGTTTGDTIMKAALPVAWGAAVIIAILMKIRGSGRPQE